MNMHTNKLIKQLFGTIKFLWLHRQSLPLFECLAGINFFSLSASYYPIAVSLTPPFFSSLYAGALAH